MAQDIIIRLKEVGGSKTFTFSANSSKENSTRTFFELISSLENKPTVSTWHDCAIKELIHL